MKVYLRYLNKGNENEWCEVYTINNETNHYVYNRTFELYEYETSINMEFLIMDQFGANVDITYKIDHNINKCDKITNDDFINLLFQLNS